MGDDNFTRPPEYMSSDEVITAQDTFHSEPTVPAWPPPQPMYRRRETLSSTMRVLIISLVTLLVLGSLSLAIYAATTQYHISLKAQANLQAQATTHVNIMVSAQARATAQVVATSQANINTTATAQTNQLATVTAQTNQATTTVTSLQSMLSTATTGSASLDDPLSDNSLSNGWDEGATKSAGCLFTNGRYQASEAQQGYFQPCIAEASSFSNFVYQVQMTIAQGNQGGILFRADGANGTFYLFRIGIDGSYALDLYTGSKQASTLTSGFSPAITTGLNQANQLTVFAKNSTFYLFANSEYVTTVSNTTLTNGQIGVVALDYSIPSQVTFSHAQVWKV